MIIMLLIDNVVIIWNLKDKWDGDDFPGHNEKITSVQSFSDVKMICIARMINQ